MKEMNMNDLLAVAVSVSFTILSFSGLILVDRMMLIFIALLTLAGLVISLPGAVAGTDIQKSPNDGGLPPKSVPSVDGLKFNISGTTSYFAGTNAYVREILWYREFQGGSTSDILLTHGELLYELTDFSL